MRTAVLEMILPTFTIKWDFAIERRKFPFGLLQQKKEKKMFNARRSIHTRVKEMSEFLSLFYVMCMQCMWWYGVCFFSLSFSVMLAGLVWLKKLASPFLSLSISLAFSLKHNFLPPSVSVFIETVKEKQSIFFLFHSPLPISMLLCNNYFVPFTICH